MDQFRKTLKHYIKTLLEGVYPLGRHESDAEIDDACNDLEHFLISEIRKAAFYGVAELPAVLSAEPLEFEALPPRRLAWFDNCLIDLNDISAITAVRVPRGFDRAHFSVYFRLGTYLMFARDSLMDAEELRVQLASAWIGGGDQPLKIGEEEANG